MPAARLVAARSQSRFGVYGSKTAEHCAQCAKQGMVKVLIRRKRCDRGSTKLPSSGALESSVGQFCFQHVKDGMVNVRRESRRSNKCGHRGCTNRPSNEAQGSAAVEYCAQHSKAYYELSLLSKRSRPDKSTRGGGCRHCEGSVAGNPARDVSLGGKRKAMNGTTIVRPPKQRLFRPGV